MARRCARWTMAGLLAAVLLMGGSALMRAQGAPPPLTADDLFDDTVLHRIRLFVNSQDWQTLKERYLDDTYYPADLHWRGLVARNVGIRSRGFGSRSGTKPGLKVDFDRYALTQEFLGLKSVVLDNLTQDPSGIKERLSMLFFRRLGLPAPREAHVSLYVNNEYVGLYAIVESVDKKFLARVFGSDETGNVENDGFLFEFRWRYPYYFGYLGPDLEAYAALFDSRTHERDPLETRVGPIEAMIRTLNETPDADFVTAMAPYLDLSLFMKHVAIENFLAESDGIVGYAGMNNFYLYRFESRPLSQFLPWDKDNAFYGVDFPVLARIGENTLTQRAWQVAALRSGYLQALLDAAASAAAPVPPPAPQLAGRAALFPRPAAQEAPPTPGWLEWEVNREYEQIREWALADPLKPFSNEQFEQAIAALQEFARRRSPFVRCEVTRILDPANAEAACQPPGQ